MHIKDKSKPAYFALQQAIIRGVSLDVITGLIQQGADVNEGDDTPLFVAVMKNRPDVLRLLLMHGARPDDIDSWTLCLYTESCPHFTYEPLVQDCPEFRHSLMQYALKYAQDDIVLLLLRAGANIHEPGYEDASMLHYAVLRENLNERIIGLLIERGVSVDARNGDWETPLILAAKHGKEQSVKLFFAKGANMHVRDYMLKSALDYAIRRGDREIIALLTDPSQNLLEINPQSLLCSLQKELM